MTKGICLLHNNSRPQTANAIEQLRLNEAFYITPTVPWFGIFILPSVYFSKGAHGWKKVERREGTGGELDDGVGGRLF